MSAMAALGVAPLALVATTTTTTTTLQQQRQTFVVIIPGHALLLAFGPLYSHLLPHPHPFPPCSSMPIQPQAKPAPQRHGYK